VRQVAAGARVQGLTQGLVRTWPIRLLSVFPFCSFMASMNLRVPELAMVPRLDSSCSRVMPLPESLHGGRARVQECIRVGWVVARQRGEREGPLQAHNAPACALAGREQASQVQALQVQG